MADGRIVIETQLETGNIEKQVSSIGQSAGVSLGGQIGSAGGKTLGTRLLGATKTAVGATVKVMGAIGAAGAGLAVSAVKVGGEFDSAMSQVEATTGATAAEMERLRGTAKEMGATTQFSASESAGAMNELALMGFKTNDIIGATPGVMALAGAAGMQLGESAQVVSNTMAQFGIEVDAAGKNAQSAADMFAAAQANSGTTASQLGQAMVYAGGAANSFGMDLASTNTALGLFANAGLKGSKAGTTFAAVTADLQEAAANGGIEINGMSVALTDAQGNFRDMGDIMADLGEATDGMSESAKAAALSQIFGASSMKGVNAILSQGTEKWDELEDAIRNSDGTANDMAKTMQDNLPGAITAMKSAVEGLQIAFSEHLTGPAKEAVQFITEQISTLTKAFDEGLDAVPAALGKVMSEILSKAAAALPKMMQIGVDLTKGLLDGLRGSLGAISESAVLLGVTFLNGLGELVPEIMLFGAEMILALAEGIVTNLPAILGAVVNIVQSFSTAITERVPELMERGKEMMLGLITGLVEALPELIETLGEIVLNMLEFFLESLPEFLESGTEILSALIDGIVANAPEIITATANILESLIITIMEHLPEILAKGVQLILHLAQGLLRAMPQILTAIMTILARLIATIIEHLPQFMAQGVKLVGQIIVGLLSLIGQIASTGAQLMGSLLKGIVGIFGSILGAIGNLGSKIISKLRGISLFSVGANIMQGLKSGVVSMAQSIRNAVVDTVMAPINWVKGKLGIHSPSRYMRDEIGQWIPEGMAVGIDESAVEVDNSMQDMLKGAIPKTSDVRPMMAGINGADRLATATVSGYNTASYAGGNRGNTDVLGLLQEIAGNTATWRDKRMVAKQLSPYVSQEVAYEGRR